MKLNELILSPTTILPPLHNHNHNRNNDLGLHLEDIVQTLVDKDIGVLLNRILSGLNLGRLSNLGNNFRIII